MNKITKFTTEKFTIKTKNFTVTSNINTLFAVSKPKINTLSKGKTKQKNKGYREQRAGLKSRGRKRRRKKKGCTCVVRGGDVYGGEKE